MNNYRSEKKGKKMNNFYARLRFKKKKKLVKIIKVSFQICKRNENEKNTKRKPQKHISF